MQPEEIQSCLYEDISTCIQIFKKQVLFYLKLSQFETENLG
jgi:hypothetical protein